MATLGSLAVNVLARTEKFTNPMQRARKEVKAFGLSLNMVKGAVLGFGTAMAAGFAGRALSNLKSTADNMDRIADRAEQLQMSASAFSRFGLAAQMSGTSLESVGNAIQTMEKKLGNGNLKINGLTLDFDRIRQLAPDQQFLTIGEAIRGMESPAMKTAAAIKLFGGAGKEMLPLFERGKTSLAAMAAESDRLGKTIDDKMVGGVSRMNDQLDKLSAGWSGLQQIIVGKIAPAVASIADKLNDSVQGLQILMNPDQFKPENIFKKAKMNAIREDLAGRSNKGLRAYGNSFTNGMGPDIKSIYDAEWAKRDERTRKSARGVLEAPVRGFSAGVGGLGSKMMEGAGALGRVLDKVKETERGLIWQGTKQSLGFGPFSNAAESRPGLRAAMGPSIGDDEMRRRLGALQLGGSRGVEVRGNAALERGTMAAFSQERRSAAQSQMVDEQRKTNKHLDEAVKAIKTLKGTNLGAQLLPANVA